MAHNILPYQRFLLESSSVKMQGFYLTFPSGSTYAHIGVAATFNEFAREVYENIMGTPPKEFIADEFVLVDDLHEAGYFTEGDLAEMEFWWGFTPKTQNPQYVSAWAFNPYDVIDALEKVFINPGRIMRSPMKGKGYVVQSIINSPEELEHYEPRPYFEEDVLPQLLQSPNPDLQAMLKYHRIKRFL